MIEKHKEELFFVLFVLFFFTREKNSRTTLSLAIVFLSPPRPPSCIYQMTLSIAIFIKGG